MTRALAAVVALAAASPASAASVSLYVPYCAPEQGKYGQCYPDEARFKADPGEANRLTITRSVEAPTFTPVVTYHDDGAKVTAASSCTQIDDHTASCKGYLLAPVVDAGDGDDVITGDGTIDGGAGIDVISGDGTLTGGPGDDTLQGGSQNDTLLGGPGRDALSGGAGNDTLQPDSGETGERDAVDGGDGIDVVSYQERKDGVSVSLQQPLAGEDSLSAIESVRGGAGDDTLTGDAGPNSLEGREGADRLTGGEGADVLDGGTGADLLDGGAGRDRLYSGVDKDRNVMVCGDASDRVAQIGVNSLVTASCERLVLSEFELILKSVVLHLPARRARAPLLVLHGITCLDRPCRTNVRVTVASGRHKGLVVAMRHFVPRREPNPPRNVRVPLTKRGAALVRRSAAPSARVVISLRDGDERGRVAFIVALGHIALGVPAEDE